MLSDRLVHSLPEVRIPLSPPKILKSPCEGAFSILPTLILPVRSQKTRDVLGKIDDLDLLATASQYQNMHR